MAQDMLIRRRLGHAALPGSEGHHAASSEQHPGPGMFNSLYSALGGWLIEPAQDGSDSTALEAPQSLSQVLEQMGNWALRGVMFNMCMPVTAGSSTRHTPLASRSDSPDDDAAAAAEHKEAALASSSGSSSNAGKGSDAAVGCAGSDVAKRLAPKESAKQPTAGSGGKPLSHTNSSANLTDQQQLATAAANPAGQLAAAATVTSSSSGRDTGGGSSSSEAAVVAAAASAVLQQEVGRLRAEVSCLRTALGTLYVTCSHLKHENQRLRSADEGGEELLSGALQQLLGQKNELQQEVARLRSQNQALQELLDYTAAAAAGPAASPTSPDSALWGRCKSSSAQGDAKPQYAAENAAAGIPAAQCTSCVGSPAAYAATPAGNSSSRAGSAVDEQCWVHQQQQEETSEQRDSCYWLVTPACSPGASPSPACASACLSPVFSSRGAEASSSASEPDVVCGVDRCEPSSQKQVVHAAADVKQLRLVL